ncbi:flagellar filament capping protein FliD [Halanaerocella petrolearia]
MVNMGLSQLGMSATGINTQQIMQQMRYIEEQPIRNIENDISQVKREKDAWRDINSRMSKLDNLLKDLKKQETYNSMTTSSNDKDVVTASADPEASKGSYDITVNQKAQVQRVVGGTKVAEAVSSESQDATTSDGDASDIAMEDGKTYDTTDITDTTIDGTTYKYGLTDSNGDVVAISENGENYTSLKSATAEGNLGSLNLDNDTGGNYDFGYQVSMGTTLKMHGTDGDQQNTLTQNSLYDTVGSDPTMNGTTIDMTASDTLSDFVTKINDSSAGVTASIVDNRVVLESSKTGADNSMTLNENGGNLLTDLGVYDSNNTGNVYQGNGGYQDAQDAEITVNGISGITSSDNTFEDAVKGVTFNIESSASSGDSTTVDVSADTKKAKNAIKEVVDQYNSVVDFIEGKTSVSGTGENIEGNVLQGDGTANRIASNLKSTLLNSISTGNEIDHMSEVGLEFDNGDYNKLTLDEEKLKKSIQDTPGQVHEFFAPDASEDANYNHDGLATKLKDYTNSLVERDGIIPNRTDRLGDQVDRMNDTIDDYQRQVDMEMQRMKEQFTRMETTVSNFNSQSSWLSSQISTLGLG